MGYWEQDIADDGTVVFWGDSPADALSDCIDQITVDFLRDVRRLPTKAELRAGMEFVLGGLDLPETVPTAEHTDEELKVIDKLGFTAFGGDLSYRGHGKIRREAHAKVMEIVHELQEPFYTRKTWENNAVVTSVPLAEEGEEQTWPDGVK